MTRALICDAIFDNNAGALLKHRCPGLMWPARAAMRFVRSESRSDVALLLSVLYFHFPATCSLGL